MKFFTEMSEDVLRSAQEAVRSLEDALSELAPSDPRSLSEHAVQQAWEMSAVLKAFLECEGTLMDGEMAFAVVLTPLEAEMLAWAYNELIESRLEGLDNEAHDEHRDWILDNAFDDDDMQTLYKLADDMVKLHEISDAWRS